jgi:hypothetical protein
MMNGSLDLASSRGCLSGQPGSLAKLVGHRVKHLQLTCDQQPMYTPNPSN